MKQKIINVLVNALLGVLTSIATIYIGATATEAIAASGAVTGSIGTRIAAGVASALA